MKSIRNKRSKGQALVAFLGFAAAMIAMLLVSFNSGQVTNAKMRAMNAADAAAYSGAAWQARTLNFQAYMNRAMVVNEVTIAQSVSLRSWVNYLDRFVENIAIVTRIVPGLGAVTTGVSRAVGLVADVVQDGMPVFEKAARYLSFIEFEAQEKFNALGSLGAADVANDIAEKNGAAISRGGKVLLVANGVAWTKFTETYTSGHGPAGTKGDGRERLRAVTLDSRDGFSENRPAKLPLLIVAEIRKQGGTDLVNYDAWKAMDSAAVCTFRFLGSCKSAPLGWGGRAGLQ
jgi:hypothetical protein